MIRGGVLTIRRGAVLTIRGAVLSQGAATTTHGAATTTHGAAITTHGAAISRGVLHSAIRATFRRTGATLAAASMATPTVGMDALPAHGTAADAREAAQAVVIPVAATLGGLPIASQGNARLAPGIAAAVTVRAPGVAMCAIRAT